MARQGTITLYEGVAKESKKPYVALKLEVGKFTKLYFDLTPLERDYVASYLKSNPTVEEATSKSSILDDDEGVL